MFIGGIMNLSYTADQYLDTMNTLNQHLVELNNLLETTENLEKKRKIRDKIVAHESVLRQTTKTYYYIKNYYSRENVCKQWI